MPSISVILSAYNNVHDLPKAMESILQQTCQDFEVIAVDDGSTDGSGRLLDHYAELDARIKVIHQTNTGLGPALHRACQAATGTYLARQDADDISAPTRFERQVAYMRCREDVVVCGTWTWFVHPQYGPEYTYEIPDDLRLLCRLLENDSNPLIHGSVMMRRDQYMLTDSGYRFRRYCEDIDLWLQLSQFGHLGVLTSLEYFYFTSVGGMSYGNIFLRHAMGSLVRQLHKERLQSGQEMTDWRLAENRIIGLANKETTLEFRQTAGYYTRGLLALRRGNCSAFREQMKMAAAGSGPLARKAQRLVRLAWAAPILRWLYRWRESRGHWRYVQPLPAGTPLPAFVATLSSALQESTTKKQT